MPPSGPAQDLRMMQLLPVYEHAKLGENNFDLRTDIRHKAVRIFDHLQIQLTSVDFVRFCWEEKTKDGRGKTVTSRATIWIGVLPDSTTGGAAFNSSNDILQLLEKHDIYDVDVAYRGSTAQPLTGPVLYAPVDDLHPLKDMINWKMSVISGYTCAAAPKKNVVLTGNKVLDDFLASVKAHTAGNQQAARNLATTQADVDKRRETIGELKKLFAPMKKDWAEVNNRVISHLDKKKFLNFKGNIIDLGLEIEPGKFMSLMYPRDDAQSSFDYPENRLYEPVSILSAAPIKEPDNQDLEGDPVGFVIKRGHTTLTSIGRLTGFDSHERRCPCAMRRILTSCFNLPCTFEKIVTANLWPDLLVRW
ncbi:hypothetical protein K488DRAFT_68056 [Vararia minispora EC-137]|uniref:Uncharacterized protein n=1 Tax=Vararia minispora EC-137 TaxID=1314806 RepID=A0ACB8QVJ7_9AGAM|nr:hypothetical protein K488DRAFT_68056 [Vararia minispora EC-137]